MKHIFYISLFILFGVSCATTDLGKLPENESYSIQNNSNTRYAERALSSCFVEIGIEDSQFLIANLKNNGYYKDVPKGVNGILRGDQGNYQIFLRSGLDDYEIISVLCHEAYHVNQFQKEDLIVKTDDLIEFRGRVYDIREVPYLGRPWELQAMIKAPKITRRVFNTLPKP